MNKKILIVRGDRQNAKALSFLLAGSGYQISSHSKAGEAIEAARHQRFDLAITDGAVPENLPDLGFICSLKEAQPSLPVFYLAQEQNLETVISCIRAGVTEVIPNASDLRSVIEMTNAFLRKSDGQDAENDVTWEDILEVERMLDATLGGDSKDLRPSSGAGESGGDDELRGKLREALADRDRISGELAQAMAGLERSQKMIEELKRAGGGVQTDSEISERILELDQRERSLRELSSRIAQQKVELETEIGELEAQKIELEEARKEVKDNLDANPAALYSLNKEFEEERAKMNAKRIELEGRVRELESELQEGSREPREEDLFTIQKLEGEIQDLKDSVSEKDFIIQQRDRELAEARENISTGGPLAEELEQTRRLLEIEQHKLREKVERYEQDKRDLEESHVKKQRELQVERRDAEISLRELQNNIKEEQLKLKVEQAQLREEMRQFEQAKQNFQEDVQDLQSKQAELKKMEAYLQKMEQTIKSGASQSALPKPDTAAAMAPFQPKTPDVSEDIESEAEKRRRSNIDASIEGPPAKTAEDQEKPDSWDKPDFNKKAGRGPLRIGRRSAF